MERKLASIQRINQILPIERADMIELIIVNSWKVVAAKSVSHKVNDLVVYCEIDSFLPIEPEFEFLRKSSFKKMGDQEGFRLKTIKLRGQISQGLIIPLEDAIKVILRRNPSSIMIAAENSDVSEMLGIVKYDPPIPANLAGKVKGNFPSFIRKTDEERVQNLTAEYEEMKQHTYYTSEKLDGSSATFYVRDGVFGVCSRNLELAEPEPFVPGQMIMCQDGIERLVQENSFWKVAREMDLKAKMLALEKNISIQGELIGEGIQGNPYKIKGQTVKFYNAFDIDAYEYFSYDEFVLLIYNMGLKTVPILDDNFKLPDTIDELLLLAEGKSVFADTQREGIVIRSLDRKISFKAISNKFLLGEKDK
jgi:RNA ligase (TIGR02306 family)